MTLGHEAMTKMKVLSDEGVMLLELSDQGMTKMKLPVSDEAVTRMRDLEPAPHLKHLAPKPSAVCWPAPALV